MPQSLTPILIAFIGVVGTLSAAIITQLVQRKTERERRLAEEQRLWNQELFRSCKDLVSVITEIEILCSGLYYNPKEEPETADSFDIDMKIQERFPRINSLVAEISLLADTNLAEMAHNFLELSLTAMDKTENPNKPIDREIAKDIKYMREHFQHMFRDSLMNDGRTSIKPVSAP